MQAKSTDQEPIALYLRQFGSYEIRSKNKLGLICTSKPGFKQLNNFNDIHMFQHHEALHT